VQPLGHSAIRSLHLGDLREHGEGSLASVGVRVGIERRPETFRGSRYTRQSTGRGAAWLARQSGGLEVPGSSPGAPTVMSSLQNWLNRLLGRGPESSASVPDPRPNAPTTPEEDAAELRRDALQEHERRIEGDSAPRRYDV
jgi:hypothetical protein